MATHSSTLAWKSPWMEEPGRLQSMGLQRVGHDWATSLVHWKISNYLKTCSASPCPHYTEHRVPHFCSPPWTPFRECWKSAAAAVPNLILIEVDANKCKFVADLTVGQLPNYQYLHLGFLICKRRMVTILEWLLGLNEIIKAIQFSSVQSLSCVRLFATPWIAARQASMSIINYRSLLKLMSIESVMPSGHLVLCRPLLLLPPIPPSIRDFSNESTLRMRWPKYWSFSFSISPSNEHSGLISFRMDWLDLLAVQGTLKSLLQHHGSKASILRHSAFFKSNSHIHMWLLEKP